MAADNAPVAPTAIGTYPVLGRIAVGGMGSVYRARDPKSGEVVAIKVVAHGDPKSLKRFEQEIAATLGLSHPHLVRGLDYGVEGETSYLVMEFVEGESLGDRIERQTRIPEGEAVRIITQVAAAIDYVHRLGIIHRDIKPDNILLTTKGVAKLTDLGLIKDTSFDLNLTRAAAGLGTPNFMAPEQFSDAKAAGILCDVYSLGATLYMAVTGVLPFEAATDLVTFKRKLTNEIKPPRQLVPALTEKTDFAIRRAIRADASQRFASVSAFVEALTGKPLPDLAPAAAAPGIERRGSVRYPSTASGRCAPAVGERTDAWPIQVKDLSVTGIGLLVGRRFEVNTALIVEIEGPTREQDQSFMVRVERIQDAEAGKWLLGCILFRRIEEAELKSLL